MIAKLAAAWAALDPLTAAGLFVLYALIDASTMQILLSVGVLNYTGNWLYAVPLAAGSWAGTFLFVRYHR